MELKKNNLAEGNPELAKEWHPTLNGDLTPADVACASNWNVWWQCENGHEWESLVKYRNRGHGCLYCCNQKVLPGYNDLATTNPELVKEWHPTLNGDLTPDQVIAGTAKKVWWRCDKAHNWEAMVNGRNKGCGCPYCCNQKVWVGYNDLATTNPDLAKEWHPRLNGDLTPKDVTCGISRKVWWQCSEGHEWERSISHSNKENRCPYCTNRKALAGYNDLTTTHPELAKEWHPTRNGDLMPKDVTFQSHRKVWWQCSEGHEWETAVTHRNRGTGCPYCCNKKVLKGYNDLATTNPELVKEWHPTLNGDLTPFDICSGTNKKVWWMCRRGHEWESVVYHRDKGVGCSKCNAEMQTSFPEQAIYYYLAKALPVLVDNRASLFGVEVDIYIPSWEIGIEYDGIYFHNSDKSASRENKKNRILSKNGIRLIRIKECAEFTPNTPNVIYCVPNSGHRYLKSALLALAQRLSEITGIIVSLDVDINRDRIEIMEQYVEGEKANSVAVSNPALVAEWHPDKNGRLNPEQISAGSDKKVWWQCSKNNEHEWIATVSSRSLGVGCPYCSNKKVLPGCNDLATTNPELAGEWHPTLNGVLKSSDVVQSSSKKIWWQCQKNRDHHWKTTVAHRTSGKGCPFCVGKKVLPGDNDLATINPELACEWHPTLNGKLKPSGVVQFSNKKVWWQCRKHEGHQWQAAVNGRSGGHGCPFCAGRQVLQGNNDLATTSPELASEWHPTLNGNLTAKDVVQFSNKRVWWQCSKHKEHHWQTAVSDRARNGCPYCINQKVLPGYNDLATTNPELAAEWHPTLNGDLTPFNVVAGSNKKTWWRCKESHDHTWESTVVNRLKGNGCPYCANKKVLAGYNDLATTHPELAAEWHPDKNGDLSSNSITSGTSRKAWWQCAKNHEWQANVASRSRGNGCPYCAGIYPVKGETDFATTHPHLAEEWHPTLNGDLTPFEVSSGSTKKIWWQCAQNHEWQSVLYSRKIGFGRCPECTKLAKQNAKNN